MVLAAYPDQQAANIVRMLLLTGARRGEVLSAKWADLDLEAGAWTKPGATTKQKTEHRVPLSAPVRALLASLPRSSEYVFPGLRGAPRRVDLKRVWPKICEAAGIKGVRLHDLRHTYASVLASSKQSLPIIGALLGQTQPATTARYAHLIDDPLRSATETAGAVLTGGAKARRCTGTPAMKRRRVRPEDALRYLDLALREPSGSARRKQRLETALLVYGISKWPQATIVERRPLSARISDADAIAAMQKRSRDTGEKLISLWRGS